MAQILNNDQYPRRLSRFYSPPLDLLFGFHCLQAFHLELFWSRTYYKIVIHSGILVCSYVVRGKGDESYYVSNK